MYSLLVILALVGGVGMALTITVYDIYDSMPRRPKARCEHASCTKKRKRKSLWCRSHHRNHERAVRDCLLQSINEETVSDKL